MKLVVLAVSVICSLSAQTGLTIALPERTRLLEDQRVDLVIEARNMRDAGAVRVSANGEDVGAKFNGPRAADLDCDATPDSVYRADLVSFRTPGWVRIEATLGGFRAVKDIYVQAFRLPQQPRSVIHFIGDGMTGEFRDAGRLVGRSVETLPGVAGLREGFFDRLLEMDQMPVSGMFIATGSDRVIADSANSATALSTGNKTFDGALGVFADGTDCTWLKSGANAANAAGWLDNPRIENLPEYLRRKFGYRVGLVTTAAVADATPAAHGAHMAERDAAFEVTRQYLESPLLGGQPAADVIMGGGAESFDPAVRADGRDLVEEFRARGYTFVSTATELNGLAAGTAKLLGLFRKADTRRHSSGIRPSSTAHMDVAYDKLGLTRPGSEPLPDFGRWTDQPFLDAMTNKAIEILGGPDGRQPFFLMVEGASIDKQSHSNHAAGAIWDVLEFDKAIGVGRAWAKARRPADTLLVVSADHGQSMTIIGVNEVSDADLYDRRNTFRISVTSPIGTQSATVYRDVNTNVRATLPWDNPGPGDSPPAQIYTNIYGSAGFPDYIDADGDGYPENRQVADKGSRRLSVGFRTGQHTGVTLPVTAEGPGAFLFTGYMDQTDIPLKIAATLGMDTSEGDSFVNSVLLGGRYPFTFGK